MNDMNDIMIGDIQVVPVPAVNLRRINTDTLEVLFKAHLYDYYVIDPLDVIHWTEALNNSTSIETVLMEVHPSMFDLPENIYMARFMAALVSLPKLTTLDWRSHNGARMEIPAAFGIFVLRHVVGLTKFCMCRHHLVGTALEFEELARYLEAHHSLSSLQIHTVPEGVICKGPLVHAFSRMPQLKSLDLSCLSVWGMDPPDFGRMFSNPSLQKVVLKDFDLDEQIAPAIVRSLRQRDPSNPLQKLSLDTTGTHKATESAAIAFILSANVPFQLLEMSLGSLRLSDMNVFQTMAQSLRSNSTLQILHLRTDSDISSLSDTVWGPFLGLLEINMSWQAFASSTGSKLEGGFFRRCVQFTTPKLSSC
ncbi:unknown protein [Seminavis robusta]|uniref:Uncharacterized protein n=1 Tax=Seminavis robusta TaxID=568900 RepID=A0A9N8EUY4_9STRA|nr:unknown protein [Seminavis robusta]|eukprot:Sro1692_g291570.1 n/a (364) ;mRNA; f:19576-20667